jgi:hypothetical protein
VPATGATEPAFDPATLPPLESLTAESDFSAFLREEVPAALRRAALRRAWSLDPTIRDFVGPADYAWDFNAPGGVPGFSLDLPADVERLIAQAVGLEEAPAREMPDDAPSDAADANAIDAPALEVAREASPEDARSREPAPPDALPTPAAAAIAEAPAVRRRHGGALPS